MFDWLRRWANRPAHEELKKHDLSRFVSEGGPDPDEARNSDKREAIFIKAQKYQPHKIARKHAAKHSAKKHAA